MEFYFLLSVGTLFLLSIHSNVRKFPKFIMSVKLLEYPLLKRITLSKPNSKITKSILSAFLVFSYHSFYAKTHELNEHSNGRTDTEIEGNVFSMLTRLSRYFAKACVHNVDHVTLQYHRGGPWKENASLSRIFALGNFDNIHTYRKIFEISLWTEIRITISAISFKTLQYLTRK